MCERCEAAKKRLTPEQCQELDELNAQMDKLRTRIDVLRDDPSSEEMSRRFNAVSQRLDGVLMDFVKMETEKGTFGIDAQYRGALFCPVLMLHACRLCLIAGYDIEDTIHMFGSELQAALMLRSETLAQQLQLLQQSTGKPGLVH